MIESNVSRFTLRRPTSCHCPPVQSFRSQRNQPHREDRDQVESSGFDRQRRDASRRREQQSSGGRRGDGETGLGSNHPVFGHPAAVLEKSRRQFPSLTFDRFLERTRSSVFLKIECYFWKVFVQPGIFFARIRSETRCWERNKKMSVKTKRWWSWRSFFQNNCCRVAALKIWLCCCLVTFGSSVQVKMKLVIVQW